MLNKIFSKIFGVLEAIKGFMLSWGVKILIVLLICCILHNIVKMSEISSRYTGEYKRLLPIYQDDDQMMNVYSVGEGEKTVVILSGFGSQSPVIQYKTLTDGLRDKYRVVIIEYFGYGYSMSIKKPRTNDNIANEIKFALDSAGINGPYILMPHSHSNIYAMRFQETYPELVQAIVSIDGLYPAEINEKYYKDKQKSTATNINITSIFELTGFERVLSYIRPDIFYIDKMELMIDNFSKEEISIYRNRIGSSYLSRTMVREINALSDNMEELKDYKYPEDLPVLEVLASDTVKEYESVKKSGNANVDLKELANNVITNSDIQKIQIIQGDHMLQLSNRQDLVDYIKEFIDSF